MTNITVRPISAADTRPLRSAILRPGQPPHMLAYAGDDAPDTLHLGAFDNGELVGIASIYREPPPGEELAGAWRLRGMATVDKVRGRGYGRALLTACIEHIQAQGGAVLWCNARTPAMGFYTSLGFSVRGEPFELPGIGEHFFMWRPIQAT
jgi:ribosomal protein S18 acetylase RimI-like enzyme